MKSFIQPTIFKEKMRLMKKQQQKKKKDGNPVNDCKKMIDPNVKCGGHAFCIGCPKNDRKRK